MKDLLEDLREIERTLKFEGYEIDHYEIRENREEYSLEKGIDERPVQRAAGIDPLDVLKDWQDVDAEDYVIEVFLGGGNSMDRVIYEPGEGLDYVNLSGAAENPVENLKLE